MKRLHWSETYLQSLKSSVGKAFFAYLHEEEDEFIPVFQRYSGRLVCLLELLLVRLCSDNMTDCKGKY